MLNEDPIPVSRIKADDIDFISVSDLARKLNARTYFSERTKKIIIYLGDKEIKVSSFNPFVIAGQHVYQLYTDTIYRDGDIYVPEKDFLLLLKSVVNTGLGEYTPDPSHPSYFDYRPNIEGIQLEEKANGTLIKIMVSGKFSKNDIGFRERHRWLYVDIFGGVVDTIALRKVYDNGLVSQIIPLQLNEKMTQLSFKLRKSIIEKQLFMDNPGEILISLKTQNDISDDIMSELERQKNKWLIDKIVIDPGHGGKDPGAMGPGGTKEKDVVLAIALELARLLVDKTDIDVLMTRDDDRFIELKSRTEFANKHGAKLFISIHANSNPSRSVKGVSTYFLGIEKSDEAREVALKENSVIKLEENGQYADLTNENFILSAMAQNVYNTESQDFAAIVQKHTSRKCNLRDRGVLQAGFYVLWGASMPNVLIETAFLSNSDEEKKLRSRSFQKKMAEGIFDSIMEFKRKSEEGI
ncbi:N-acetylmuramoyl-L-alanine amidase [candidate division KSB1 bacterium]|nr:N-acetylmuramoyl-L-alanine amidase [candidate division KSB1 bacterium]